MRIIVAAGFLLLASVAQAQTDGFEFKGIALGSDAAPFESNKRFLCYTPSNTLADRACGLRREGETIAGVPVDSLMLLFYDNKLHTIFISVASKNFDEVVAALQEKYGKVVSQNEEIHNRMGATFNDETYSWRKPGQVLTAEKYAGDINHSRLTFQTEAGLDEFSRRSESKKKANAKDL
jgi:hypothetical protein